MAGACDLRSDPPRVFVNTFLTRIFVEKSGAASDVVHTVLSHVCAEDLVKCSMVCKHLRILVDKFFANVFARDLMWWGSFEQSPGIFTHPDDANDMSFASWNKNDGQFDLTTSATSCTAQTMWMLNTCLDINVLVRMRLQIMLPANNSHVHLHGEDNYVQKILQRGHASVDVLAWRIMNIQGLNNAATVTLFATEFSHNSTRVKLVLGAPVVLEVHNVPVQRWPYRCLWVMRGVRKCMNCHQRLRVMQCADVRHTEHRVLCTHCIEHFYVRQSQLRRRWRVRSILIDVQRFCFVNCFMGAPTTLWPRVPERLLLKQDIAEYFKCASWSEFIANNHKHSNPQSRRWLRRDTDRSKFKFSSYWFSSSMA